MKKILLDNSFQQEENKEVLMEMVSRVHAYNPKKTNEGFLITLLETETFAEDYSELENILVSFFLEVAIVQSLDYYSQALGLNETESENFSQAFFTNLEKFLEYSKSLTLVLFRLYMNENEKINIESFLSYNLNFLYNDLDRIFKNETLMAGLVSSGGVSKENFDVIYQIIDMLPAIKEAIEEDNLKVKDVRIYFEDDELKMVNEHGGKIELESINHFIEDNELKFTSTQKIYIYLNVLEISRIIIFASVDEETKNMLGVMTKLRVDATTELNVFYSAELKPKK